MNKRVDNTWTRTAAAFAQVHPQLAPLISRSLPEQDTTSEYMVDLAHSMSHYMTDDGFSIKGLSRFRENRKWNELRPLLFFSFAMGFISSIVKSRELLSEQNASHLARVLDQSHQGLGGLIVNPADQSVPPEIDMSWVAARSIRLLTEVVSRCGLSFKDSDSMQRMVVLTAKWQGALAAISHLASNHTAPELRGDILLPLRSARSAKIEKSAQEGRGFSQPEPERTGGPARNGREEYPLWVDRCKEMGLLQRMPERLFLDLIPPFEVADHTVKDVDRWRDELERAFPGRQRWLDDEGVTPADFEEFWSTPSWVQNFIEALMSRNLQLEYQAHRDIGEDHEEATFSVLMFIPRYSLRPAEEFDFSFSPLPFELFHRVRRHLAVSDSAQVQKQMIANDCLVATDYLRRRIKSGLV